MKLKKNLGLILSMCLPLISLANEQTTKEPVEKNTNTSKSLYEKLAEKGIGEIKESADSGRTGEGGGNSRCVVREK